MLRSRTEATTHEPGSALAKRHLLAAVARRGLPGVVEATVVPTVVFLAASSLFGARWAMIAVFVWAFASVTWRKQRGSALPALVAVTLCGLAARTMVGVVSGSTFAYFAQPIASRTATAGALVVSVLIGRPLVARIGHDFCPIAPDVARRPAVARLFAGLTMLWACAQILTAAATLALLMSLDTNAFVAVKAVTSLSISLLAIAITIAWALRVVHREKLAFMTA